MTTWNRRVAAVTRVREAEGDPDALDARLRSLGLPQGLNPDDALSIITLLRLAESRGKGFSTTVMARVETAPGHTRQVQIVVMGNDQGVTTLVGDAHEEMMVDHVTGLPGRDYLLATLDQGLQATLNAEHHVGVFAIDIDRFKNLNDSRGFAAGDETLRTLAASLEANLRPDDTLVRMGGDAFAVVSPDVLGVAEAIAIGEHLRRVTHDVPIDSPVAGLTLSIGVAIGRADRSNEDLLREAETALFQAKGRGRDRCELFDDDLRTLSERRVTVDQQLRRAIEDHAIQVHYQPIIEVATRRIVGVEALLRLVDDNGQHLDPRELVEAAEDAGLIRQFEETVLQHGAAALNALPDLDSDLFLSVNVSDRMLGDSRFPLALARTLNAADFPAERLHLEISRNIFEAKGAAIRLVTQLRALGVCVVIDEFIGASDAELVVPEGVDLVKLDKRLVHGVHGDRGRARAELVVGGILDHDLEVCAVGVETEDDFHAVKALGCTYAQGYLFSPPVEEPQLSALLDTDG